MKRWALAVVVATGLLIGFSLYALSRGDGGRAPAKRVALNSDAADLWPLSQSWVWTVDPVATRRQVRVCVRTTESKIPPGTSPSIPLAPQLPPKGAERHSVWLLGDRRIAGRITCQLIDFREVALGEAAGKQPLRLLVRLRLGGALIGITGQESILAGESFVGASDVQPRWAGDELHLLAVYTRTGDTLFAHHVLVHHSDDE
jgi:hypothetical protein